MKSRSAWMAAGALAMVLAVAGPLFATFSDDTEPELKTPPLDSASASVSRFFDSYLNEDGRVTKDGGPTISREQSYALLLSAATRDRARFDRVWNWTSDNLVQSNGLLAPKWENGSVISTEPIDGGANADAARALVIASRSFGDPSYADHAKRLAGAITAANVFGSSSRIIPGDHSPRAEQALSEVAGSSWDSSVQAQQRRYIDDLIGVSGGKGAKRLPPDSATSGEAGTVAAPGALYSADAARVPVRLVESCSEEDRQQASRIWSVLNRSRESRSASSLELDGSVRDATPSAMSAVASAAAAKAGRDDLQMYSLLDVADKLESDKSTAYGAAWVALGRVMLTTNWLGDC